LPLAITLRDEATLDNFLVRPRLQPVIDALVAQRGAGGEPFLYLHGPAGSGKSHLLQACCHTDGTDALYLPLAELRGFDPAEVLQGVEGGGRLCLDDLDAVAGEAGWERSLFGLCNRARESGCRLVFAASAAPRALGIALPDLASRLGWGLVFQLPRADDEDLAAILRFRAGRRGLPLREEVAAYIVNRAPRDSAQLLAVLDVLDRASLQEQRGLSIPFVRHALGWGEP
jgi:DnaA family protein